MRAGDRRTLGGLLLLALCVGLAAWLLGTSDEKDAGGVGVGAATSESGATSAAVPAVDEKAAAPQSLASDAASVASPEPDAPPGEALRFTGRVVDEAGKPVAGALVTHWPCLAFRQQAGLPRSPIWSPVAWEQLSATRTDVQGRFALDSRDVPPERVDSLAVDGGRFSSFEHVEQLWPHLLVEHQGFGTEEVQVPASRAGVGEAGDIVLHAGLTLTGRLVDPHGAGVADVALALHSPERAEEGSLELSDLQKLRITARTDAAGGFRVDGVPFGPWELSGEPAGFAPFDRDVRPERPGVLDLGEITLDPGQALAGQVLDDHGAPLAGAEVRVQMMMQMDGVRGPDRAAAAWGMRMRAGDRFFEPRVRTESDGSFVVQGLWTPIESYRVTARAPSFDAATADEVKPGTQDVVLQLEPEATWRVLVADAVDQRAVPGVKLEASRSIKDSDGWSGSVDVVADGDDGWLLHGAGRWRTEVTVAAPGHAKTKFTLDGLGAGESRQQQLLLPRELVLDGRVLDETGAPLPGASVKLNPADYDDAFLGPRTVTSGADGRFHAGQLAPATWHITASAPDHVPLRRPRNVVLTADAPSPPLELMLPAGGRIEGELRDSAGRGVPRVHVMGTSHDPAVFAQVLPPGEGAATQPQLSEGAIEAETFTGSDGRFVLEGLPAGSWSLDGGSGAQATVQVIARATAQAVLVRRPPARVEGRVSSGGAPLAGARVELGRKDGFRFGWYPQMATKTDESGQYEFQRDSGGDFAVLARDGEVQTEPVFVHLAVDSLVHADLAFSTGRLTGRVTLAGEGTPLPDVSLELTRPVGDVDKSHLERSATSGADGRFVVERLPAGSWTVAAHAALLLAPEPREVKVAEGEATPELELEMTRAGDIDLTLASPEKWGRVVLVELQPLAGQKPLLDTFLPGRRPGLGPLAPGDYVLNLKTTGDDGKGWALRHTERVTIAAGQTLTLHVAD